MSHLKSVFDNGMLEKLLQEDSFLIEALWISYRAGKVLKLVQVLLNSKRIKNKFSRTVGDFVAGYLYTAVLRTSCF